MTKLEKTSLIIGIGVILTAEFIAVKVDGLVSVYNNGFVLFCANLVIAFNFSFEFDCCSTRSLHCFNEILHVGYFFYFICGTCSYVRRQSPGEYLHGRAYILLWNMPVSWEHREWSYRVHCLFLRALHREEHLQKSPCSLILLRNRRICIPYR